MKAYSNNNEIIFTTDEYPTLKFIVDRDFTQDEKYFPKLITTQSGFDIAVDTDKKKASDKSKFDVLKSKLLSDIDDKTSTMITESGYPFANTIISSSLVHQSELSNLYDRRNDNLFKYPFSVYNKDNSKSVTVNNAADIETMYLTLAAQIFEQKQSGNIEKDKVNAITNLQDLLNYTDSR